MVTLPAYGLPSTVTDAHRQEVPGRFAPAIPAIAETLSADAREDAADDQRQGEAETFAAAVERTGDGERARLRGGPRFALDLPNAAFTRLLHEGGPPRIADALGPRAAAAYRRPLETASDGGALARRVSLTV